MMNDCSPKHDLLGLSQPQMTSMLGELGEKPYRTNQVMKWLHHRFVDDFSQMTDISKKLRAEFENIAEIVEPKVISEKCSTDGTRKWLMQSRSGSAFETVYIPEDSRGTLCVSSQVGCALDCKFCSTGKQGFNSNLTSGEIVGQLRVVERILAAQRSDSEQKVTNVVFMGMGEPLLNADQVIPAVSVMMDDLGYGISKRKVTISTAGVVPGIQRLKENTDASLAVSLHAPNDQLRDQLVPINRKYPIAELLDACRDYALNLGEKRTVTIEYILLDGVNDQAQHVRELIELLRDFPCKINLIPFNGFPGSGFKRPSSRAVRFFQEKLVQAGYATMVRTTRGEDIDAACGQLAGKVEDRTKRSSRYQKIAQQMVD
jgi:23S rRNA (adenine2503-C2)-methyltransferase